MHMRLVPAHLSKTLVETLQTLVRTSMRIIFLYLFSWNPLLRWAHNIYACDTGTPNVLCYWWFRNEMVLCKCYLLTGFFMSLDWASLCKLLISSLGPEITDRYEKMKLNNFEANFLHIHFVYYCCPIVMHIGLWTAWTRALATWTGLNTQIGCVHERGPWHVLPASVVQFAVAWKRSTTDSIIKTLSVSFQFVGFCFSSLVLV